MRIRFGCESGRVGLGWDVELSLGRRGGWMVLCVCRWEEGASV